MVGDGAFRIWHTGVSNHDRFAHKFLVLIDMH